MARNQELYPTDFPEITPSPQAVLRSHLPDVGDLGLQETDVPEGLGAYTQKDVGAPVSDKQAQRWMEETQIESARIELEMLRDKMLNSRRDLIDELYGGDDPSLRNTKPIIDELRKMETKTFMESIGDIEEMTPQQKLQVAIAKVNIGKGVTATVQGEKQKDMQTLNDAVGKYNAGITAQMTSIQEGATAIQELHATQDEAMAEIETARIEAEAEPTKKEPSPVTWTTATKQLSRRFGKEDPMGNIIITPELAGMNRIGQKKLVQLKKEGMEPLEAINVSEAFARHIDSRYWTWIDAPNRTKKDIGDFNKQFKTRYGYTPRIRPR